MANKSFIDDEGRRGRTASLASTDGEIHLCEGPQPTEIVGQKEGLASLLRVYANNGRDNMYSGDLGHKHD